MRSRISVHLLDSVENARVVLESERLPILHDVVDVDIFARHVRQKFRAVGTERHVGGGYRRHASLTHRIKIRVGVRNVPRGEVRQASRYGPLSDLSHRLCESHDSGVIEPDIGVECPDGNLLGSHGVNSDALALRVGGAGVTARLQVDEHVATRFVSITTVRLPDVQLSENKMFI